MLFRLLRFFLCLTARSVAHCSWPTVSFGNTLKNEATIRRKAMTATFPTTNSAAPLAKARTEKAGR